MTTTFKQGDRVRWNTSQGETHGKVVRKPGSRDNERRRTGHGARADRGGPPKGKGKGGGRRGRR